MHATSSLKSVTSSDTRPKTHGNFVDRARFNGGLSDGGSDRLFLVAAIAETRSLSADSGTFGGSKNRAWSKMAPLVGLTNIATLFNVCEYKYAHAFDKGCAFVFVTVLFKE